MTPTKTTLAELVDLHSTMDADIWAREFMRIYEEKKPEIDLDWIRSWFANLIMCGWDHANQKQHPEINIRGYKISYFHEGTFWIEGPDGDGIQTGSKFEKLIADFFEDNM